jgi:riboflavin biosynthesis pyrimidine reductase
VDLLLARQLRGRQPAAHRVSPGGPGQPEHPLIGLAPFEVLYEADLQGYDLPEDLERLYGRIGFGEPVLYSNFVSSIDGVAALGSTPSAGSVISRHNDADRFLMGLLRACADAVLVGAGTLRATPGHHWTPAHVYPDMATSFAKLRKRLGRAQEPRMILLTRSGDIDVWHPAIVGGATVLTTAVGAATLGSRLPESCDLIEVGKDTVDIRRAVEELRERGYNVLLTEGGPHVMGELIELGLLDEAFLTISPVIAGRDGEERLGMVAGAELLPLVGAWSELLSARRHEDYVFLRYGLRNRARP